MHPLLSKLLKKRKIEFIGLSPDEKKDFDRWELILSEGELTVDKIMNFCKSQVAVIETQFRDLNNSKEKNERLILLHSVYKCILNISDTGKAERENLENYLNQLLIN